MSSEEKTQETNNKVKELQKKYPLSENSIITLIQKAEGLVAEKGNALDWGAFAIQTVPVLIATIRDFIDCNKIRGKERANLLIEVLCYVIEKTVHDQDDAENIINIIETTAPAVINLAFASPEEFKAYHNMLKGCFPCCFKNN